MNIEERVDRLVTYVEIMERQLGFSPEQAELALHQPEAEDSQPARTESERIAAEVVGALESVADVVDLSEVRPLVATSLDDLLALSREDIQQALEQARAAVAVLEEVSHV